MPHGTAWSSGTTSPRALFTSHGGEEIDQAGDGFVVAFATRAGLWAGSRDVYASSPPAGSRLNCRPDVNIRMVGVDFGSRTVRANFAVTIDADPFWPATVSAVLTDVGATSTWKADKGWSGCRKLTVAFVDGTAQEVTLQLRK